MIRDVDRKSADELLAEFAAFNDHNTLRGEQYSAAILVKSAKVVSDSVQPIGLVIGALRRQVEEADKNSQKFSNRIFWLNVIVGIGTIVGAAATVIQAYVAFFKP